MRLHSTLSADHPDRADHLWRYTPWKKIHPTGDISDIPSDFSIPEVSLKTIDGKHPSSWNIP